jgi:Porin subfamily
MNMKMVKSLVLGSAATIVAMSGAQAADLPVKAKPVEYVRICSLYGAGFYYIPGTDTCIKIGGYLRAEVNVHGGNSNQPLVSGDGGVNTRYLNQYSDYSRMALTVDTRTATEYGVVRTFGQADFTFSTQGYSGGMSNSNVTTGNVLTGNTQNNYAGNGVLGVEYAFIQFAGFTFGKSASAYVTPWQGFPGNNTSYLVGGYDTITGINNVQYTAQFGNGVSASIGVDDSSANDYNRTQIVNAAVAGSANNTGTSLVPSTANTASCALAIYGAASSNCTNLGTAYGGAQLPDLVANIRIDQAWGLFQVSGAVHDVDPGYWTTANTITSGNFIGGQAQTGAQNLGHPDSKAGGAVQVALQFKNLPTGPGDDFKIEGSWSLGASKYVLGTSAPLGGSFYMFGNGPTGSAGKLAIGAITDGVYSGGPGNSGVGGTQVQLTQGWGIRGAFNHNWSPEWSTSLFGGAAQLNYNNTAKAIWCASYVASVAGPGGTLLPGSSCNPGFTLSEIGLVTRWTPVKNLTFSTEVLYAFLHTDMSGSVTGTPSSAFPVAAGTVASPYVFGDKGTVSANFRVQRNF